jgi:uncharacterized membrane protein YphA (DoxX/SURF4 family)
MTLAGTLRAFDITGENTDRTSPVTTASFTWLNVIFGLIWLYDSWSSLSPHHKAEMAAFLGLPMESAWLHLLVALTAFVRIALAAALLSGRCLRVMGWAGVAYSLYIWLAVENGGDFGDDATDPGLGLPYLVVFLYVLGAERLRAVPDLGQNFLFALARVVFGLLWAYDAILKFEPYFLTNFLDYLTEAQKDAVGWVAAYDQFWVALTTIVGPLLMAVAVGIAEAAIAIGLLAGRGLRVLGPIGLVLSFVIWSAPESWGGPYSHGSLQRGVVHGAPGGPDPWPGLFGSKSHGPRRP